jgi:hypothetical protein
LLMVIMMRRCILLDPSMDQRAVTLTDVLGMIMRIMTEMEGGHHPEGS